MNIIKYFNIELKYLYFTQYSKYIKIKNKIIVLNMFIYNIQTLIDKLKKINKRQKLLQKTSKLKIITIHM
jgi:hypothetical protein